MSSQKIICEKISVPKKNKRHFAFGTLILAAFFLVLCSSDVAIEYMKKGLRLCASTVIPSLFPFMVISELIVVSGIGVRISRLFAKPMRLLFGISEHGAAAYILGLVCGFPIGAKTAVSMYDRGIITKGELERLLTFCNNPGSAFVISAVGVSLFGNKRIGLLMYVSVILSSIVVGFVGKFLYKSKDDPPCEGSVQISNELSVKAVTGAVQSSALAMLTVCAYVVFFSALIGCVGAFFSRLCLPNELVAAIFGFFELSSGVGTAAELADRVRGVLLCSLFVGWSGLSVAFQIMSVCDGRNISFKPYFIAKAAQGIICALFMGISIKLLLGEAVYDTLSDFPYRETGAMRLVFPFAAFLAAVLLVIAAVYAFVLERLKTLPECRKKFKKGIDKQNFV